MPTVVFYISGHGFGHASRQVEIIHALVQLVPATNILIRSTVSPALLQRTLRVPYTLRPGPCDTGIIQTSSVRHDDPATVAAAVEFYRTLDARVEADTRALDHENVVLVVGDVPPLAFEVAARLGVPGVAITNFTWDWIYETHSGLNDAAPWLVPRLRAAYRRATLALRLPFSGGFEVFPAVRALPLVARRPARSRDETRAYFDIPRDRPAVLLSFGGYGLPDLDLAAADCLATWTVVSTDRTAASPGSVPGVVFVEEAAFLHRGFRYEDLVGAVDVVLTKPGYGIIAECIAAGTAVLYTSRGAFREYDLLTTEMPRFLRTRFLPPADLMAGRWRTPLENLLGQPAPAQRMDADGADAAARELSALLAGSR